MREGEPNDERNRSEKVEINELLETKELFEWLANVGLKAFKPDFAQQLEKSGAEKEDIDLAIKFMGCLAAINQLVFRDRVELVFDTSEKPENFIQYTPEKKEKYGENYLISVKRFGATIRRQMEEKRKVFLDEGGRLLSRENENESHVVSIEELLLGIAIHEVRHRLQHKSGINKIKRGDRVVCDGVSIDDEFITLQASFMDSQRKKIKEGGILDEEVLDRKTDSKELDAIIIEKMAVSRLHHRKTSLEQLKQIATTEPEE